MQPAVYMLASDRNGTIYTGVTSNLARRITQHKQNEVEGFTKTYSVHKLVWYEFHETMLNAIETEKKIKNRSRQFKIQLIEKENPYWNDLSEEIKD